MELFRGGTNTKNKEGYPETERDGKNRTDEIRDPMALYKLDDLTWTSGYEPAPCYATSF